MKPWQSLYSDNRMSWSHLGVHEICTHTHALTFAFAFDAFENSLQNFGLIWTGSKFQNFYLGDGKS
jgi:hypothetical protein